MRKSCCIWLADTWPGLVEAVCVKDWFCFVAVPPTGEFCWPSVTFPCSLMLHLSHQTMTKMSPLLVWGLRRCCRALEGRNKNQKRQLGGLAGAPMLPAAELQDWMGAAPSSLVKAWPSQCTLVVFWKHQGLQAKRDVLETWHTGACIQSCESLCCCVFICRGLGMHKSVRPSCIHSCSSSIYFCMQCSPSSPSRHAWPQIPSDLPPAFFIFTPFLTQMHTQLFILRSGLILHMLHSQLGSSLPMPPLHGQWDCMMDSSGVHFNGKRGFTWCS